MTLPSKELLSEVLNEEYNERLVDWYEIEDNYLCTYYDCGRKDKQGRPTGLGIEINIYELQHLMKEWALVRDYQLLSGAKRKSKEYICTSLNDRNIRFSAPTEFESVCKACEWILENKDNK